MNNPTLPFTQVVWQTPTGGQSWLPRCESICAPPADYPWFPENSHGFMRIHDSLQLPGAESVGDQGDSPVRVRVIDHQEDLGFLCRGGCRAGRVVHQSRCCLRGLLHGAGDGAEDAAAGGGGVWGLGWLQVLSLCGRRHRGARGAVGTLQVHHVAIGQVCHEAAVWETPPEEIHRCSAMGKLNSAVTSLEDASVVVWVLL